ncbi:MAG: DNA polymerase III subunit epsilon, partial [Actinobacteria bacterium]|nr:DNA polymerase III subunit epsilon [Actinomycetota bacterium]
NLYWKDLPKNQISALPGDCTHTHCSFFPTRCFLHGLRQRAKSADIVVTNHALLFRDVVADGGILPPIRHWIIDEAHSAEDEARKQLSPSIDVRDLKITLDSLYQSPSSTLASLRRKAVKADGGQIISVAIAKAEEQARSVDVIAESFFSFVKDLENLAEKSEYDYVDLWVNSELRDSGPWGVVVSTGHSLEKRMQKLIELCKETLDLLEASSGELADLRAELLGMIGRLYEMREALVLCVDGEDDNYAYWARLNRHPDRQMETLTASLLDVGEAFLDSFYPRIMSVVYTSATIATGDSFEHFARGVGLDRLEEGKWKSLRLDSSYDFENNMVIYVPTDIPNPNEKGYRAAFNDLLFDVHVAMGGSVLTLFTNRREMEYAYESLEARLASEGLNLICQMKGMSAKRLRDEFLADEKASLFALRSFWEGFDAPGDTLRCVIISRLPFSRPNDPLTLERSRRERNAWSRYALPEAIIDLKQAAGRLIRSSSDKGFLVLADSRLITKGYGKKFLSAMPSQAHYLLSSEELSRNISERLLSDGNPNR